MTRPVVVGSRAELDAALGSSRRTLVPTMGALHEGHASLMHHARRVGEGPVVVSVFVNPLQFAPGEDLDRYPRTFDADLELCAREGVDVVFAPTVGEVYPDGDPQVTLDPGPLGAELEGVSRPTHFRGVLTVVAKLLGLVAPRVAVFGEKDYQQLTLIRRMVADLCLDVRVEGAATVRDPDGLALSSRNRYLTDHLRADALALSRALLAARDAGDPAVAERVLAEAPGVDVDYLEVRGPDLGPAPASGPARLLLAARVGDVRLIDNVALEIGRRP